MIDPGAVDPMAVDPATFHPRAVEETAEVIANRLVNAEYRHLVARCSAVAAAAKPGQFFQLLCPSAAGEAPFLRRPMSVYEAAQDALQVGFLYKVTGAGTRGLATLAPGDGMGLFGPLGHGFALHPRWRHVVAVGRGAGLATLAPLARVAREAGIGVTAILSARRPALMLSDDVFRAHGATVLTVTDSEGTSGPAHVERLLRGLVAEGRCDAFFTCGSARLLRVQQRLSQELDVPGQVAMEQQMACGLGMCFCCVRDFNVDGTIVHKRVCWDGPVFDMREALG
jgi:dihydroorotate dehydrogenase electron transfer subunit